MFGQHLVNRNDPESILSAYILRLLCLEAETSFVLKSKSIARAHRGLRLGLTSGFFLNPHFTEIQGSYPRLFLRYTHVETGGAAGHTAGGTS